MGKYVENIKLSKVHDPQLIAKLNAVAPFMYRNVHDTARFLLTQGVDEKIGEYEINMSDYQPAVG